MPHGRTPLQVVNKAQSFHILTCFFFFKTVFIQALVIVETVYRDVSQTPSNIFFDTSSRKEAGRAIYKLAFYRIQIILG